MIDRAQAEEHLRVIRSLMEKATIYRAISAEAAAVGGVLAVAGSFAFGNPWRGEMIASEPVWGLKFVAVWLGILFLTAAANVFFLWNEARRRDAKFASSGMRLAARALLPAYLVAGAATLMFGFRGLMQVLVPVWIVCHGLGLLATAHFAPRSLSWLGWAFLLAGLGCIPSIASASGDLFAVQRWMAGTFGLFHLIYAVCTWPRKSKA